MGFVTDIINFDEILKAEDFLNSEELEKYRFFRFEKRRNDWLAGRFAAKKTILKVFQNVLHGKDLHYKDISVKNDADRKPYFEINGSSYPNVLSISHCANYAIAAVGIDNNSLLGIDLEIIERRPHSWAEEAFTPDEIAEKTTPFELTKLWTQKEAVLKALGLGLAADLHQVKIMGASPLFLGKILSEWKKKGSKRIKISSGENPKGFITSIAYDL